MDDIEFYQKLDEIMNELLKGIGNIVLEDYGKLNDVCMEITYDNFVKVEFRENNVYKFKDYHIDCFNYEFSCDIRKIKET